MTRFLAFRHGDEGSELAARAVTGRDAVERDHVGAPLAATDVKELIAASIIDEPGVRVVRQHLLPARGQVAAVAARRKLFAANDRDGDGVITSDEYDDPSV